MAVERGKSAPAAREFSGIGGAFLQPRVREESSAVRAARRTGKEAMGRPRKARSDPAAERLNARPGRLELQQPQLRGRLPINSPSARARLARRDPIQQLRRRGPETNKHAPRQGFHRWSRGRRQQQLSRDQRRDALLPLVNRGHELSCVLALLGSWRLRQARLLRVLRLQTWRYSFYSFVHPCLTCWVGHRRGIYARGCRWGSRFG
ncbi:hypothetical protein PAHAL_1G345800 [Panicum hallii]|uniref:Uncharacterized protein n=1 Tax=Panicum hallii TaxID=206008 RepID=A0A2T8KX75_9POAL|nr:hypothetical protein PAHAL_1G345800 [Panicum hallii]